MKKEWTEQDLRAFAENAQTAFEDVTLTEADEEAADTWQDDGLQVDYVLRNGQVDCVLRRLIEADGKLWQLQMTAPLAGSDLPEDRMTARERNLYRELNQEAHTAIEACGGTAQGQSIMAKLNTKMGIGMKTLTDRSTRNLAEMLSEGSSQGVMDCIKSQKDYPDAAPGSKRLMQKLQDLEEENRLKLEQFL